MNSVTINQTTRLAQSYLDAKQCVIDAGFAYEIDWQEDVRFSDLTEERFLHEYTWVVFSSGFRETVLRKKFSDLALAFGGLVSAAFVAQNRGECRRLALRKFGHRGKVTAVLDVCAMIDTQGFEFLRHQLHSGGVDFIDQLPFMGPATSYHLAKNIGLNVVKPDRHLVRIAAASGFQSPDDLCDCISKAVGDALPVIDIVIWRYATLHPKEELPGFIPDLCFVSKA
jgi:hypothetical protein